MSSEPTTRQRERRAFQRFDIERSVRYRVIGIEVFGSGKTVNMSRSGVLLALDRVLSPGLQVEVEVDWPVRLADKVPLKLVVKGKIVRSKKNDVALVGMEIGWYAFHIASDDDDGRR